MYKLVPPSSLWENKPKFFSVYDARDLQEMLGSPVDGESTTCLSDEVKI